MVDKGFICFIFPHNSSSSKEAKTEIQARKETGGRRGCYLQFRGVLFTDLHHMAAQPVIF